MGRDRPLPTIKMQEKWGHLPYLRYESGGRWCAACPNCGTGGHDSKNGYPDRFVIWPPGSGKSGTARGWCRRCGHQEFVDEDHKPTPEEIAQAKQREMAWRKSEEEARQSRIQWLRNADFWIQFHEEMTRDQRTLWHQEGIKDWAIEMHKLGYRPGKTEEDGALSIPYFANNWDEIVSLQYRLICPNGRGKYRFLRGVSAEWFRPWPEDEIKGVVLILEGAKKALVTYEIAHDIRYKGTPVTMIASPASDTPSRLIDQLDDAELLIWMMDPDAYVPRRVSGKEQPPPMQRNIEQAGHERSLIVRPPGKIDDLIIEYGLGRDTIQSMINQAGPYFGYRH